MGSSAVQFNPIEPPSSKKVIFNQEPEVSSLQSILSFFEESFNEYNQDLREARLRRTLRRFNRFRLKKRKESVNLSEADLVWIKEREAYYLFKLEEDSGALQKSYSNLDGSYK